MLSASYPCSILLQSPFSVPNPDRGEGEDTGNVLLVLKLQEPTGNNPSGGLGYSTHTHVCVFLFCVPLPVLLLPHRGNKMPWREQRDVLTQNRVITKHAPSPTHPQWGRDWVLYAHCCSLFFVFSLVLQYLLQDHLIRTFV